MSALYSLGAMVLNATFNNISVISLQSVLLVEETRVPGENHRPADKSRFECTTLVYNVKIKGQVGTAFKYNQHNMAKYFHMIYCRCQNLTINCNNIG
jgi:hypothetical protein